MDRVRFAILGTAKIARTVGPKIQSATVSELVGIASRSVDTAQGFADDHGISRTYGSYHAAIDDPDVDALYIPLPPSMHLEWTTRAAEAGKHVLCEKPLARSADECRQMIDVCQQHNVVLLDGVMWYHTPRAAAIRNAAAEDSLGELRHIASAFTFRWDTMPIHFVNRGSRIVANISRLP